MFEAAGLNAGSPSGGIEYWSSQASHRYLTPDTAAAVLVSGYWDAAYDLVEAGDTIAAGTGDGFLLLRVGAKTETDRTRKTGTIEVVLAKPLSMLDFEAATDGTDASAAIQAAFDVGGEIKFEAGTYTLEASPIVRTNDVVIRLNGATLKASSPMGANDGVIVIGEADPTATGTTGYSNITILGPGTIDGNNISDGITGFGPHDNIKIDGVNIINTTATAAIHIGGEPVASTNATRASKLAIRNVTTKDCNEGFYLRDATGVIVQNCTLDGSLINDAIELQRCENFNVTQNYVLNSYGAAVQITADEGGCSRNGNISNNTLINDENEPGGPQPLGIALSSGASTANTYSISGDTITDNGHGLSDGDYVFLEGDNEPPSPLRHHQGYFVVESDTNTFKLSETRGGTAITSTTSGSGTQYWTSVGIDGVEMTSNVIHGKFRDGINIGARDRNITINGGQIGDLDGDDTNLILVQGEAKISNVKFGRQVASGARYGIRITGRFPVTIDGCKFHPSDRDRCITIGNTPSTRFLSRHRIVNNEFHATYRDTLAGEFIFVQDADAVFTVENNDFGDISNTTGMYRCITDISTLTNATIRNNRGIRTEFYGTVSLSGSASGSVNHNLGDCAGFFNYNLTPIQFGASPQGDAGDQWSVSVSSTQITVTVASGTPTVDFQVWATYWDNLD